MARITPRFAGNQVQRQPVATINLPFLMMMSALLESDTVDPVRSQPQSTHSL